MPHFNDMLRLWFSVKLLLSRFMETLFQGPGFSALKELRTPALDAAYLGFVHRNPDYEIMVCGAMPSSEVLLHDFFDFQPPPERSSEHTCSHKLILRDSQREVIGLMDVVEHLRCEIDGVEWRKGVCHLAFIQIADELHGTGMAQAVMHEFENWAKARGFEWMRLGVLDDNPRGKRFWQKQGFEFVDKREGVMFHERAHTVHICLKRLT
jgi:ribosomal protein S18 acetylase RimI-like enzyme